MYQIAATRHAAADASRFAAPRTPRATLANMRQNLVIALVTVAGLMAGVFSGDVHMAEGMLIHQLSVLIVIANGMRLLRTPREQRRERTASRP